MSNYTPVSCELYDRLEAAATLHKKCNLAYQQENGQLIEVQVKIVDVYAEDGADWCRLSDDTVIRLDKIEKLEPI